MSVIFLYHHEIWPVYPPYLSLKLSQSILPLPHAFSLTLTHTFSLPLTLPLTQVFTHTLTLLRSHCLSPSLLLSLSLPLPLDCIPLIPSCSPTHFSSSPMLSHIFFHSSSLFHWHAPYHLPCLSLSSLYFTLYLALYFALYFALSPYSALYLSLSLHIYFALSRSLTLYLPPSVYYSLPLLQSLPTQVLHCLYSRLI